MYELASGDFKERWKVRPDKGRGMNDCEFELHRVQISTVRNLR